MGLIRFLVVTVALIVAYGVMTVIHFPTDGDARVAAVFILALVGYPPWDVEWFPTKPDPELNAEGAEGPAFECRGSAGGKQGLRTKRQRIKVL